MIQRKFIGPVSAECRKTNSLALALLMSCAPNIEVGAEISKTRAWSAGGDTFSNRTIHPDSDAGCYHFWHQRRSENNIVESIF